MACELCETVGGVLLWQGERLRIVHVSEPGYPGYCRVVWEAHVKEMTDLEDEDRAHLMDVVFAVESVLREQLEPLKLNLASLGNHVPHLHWHVVPRFADDPHFPHPIWGKAVRGEPDRDIDVGALKRAVLEALD